MSRRVARSRGSGARPFAGSVGGRTRCARSTLTHRRGGGPDRPEEALAMEDTDTTWRGKVGGMTADEMEAFLARGKAMRIACLKADGSPYITVCWHDWHDGYFWLVPRQRSAWAKLLENDGRLAFVVD